jgi:hypothetical protein
MPKESCVKCGHSWDAHRTVATGETECRECAGDYFSTGAIRVVPSPCSESLRLALVPDRGIGHAANATTPDSVKEHGSRGNL